MKASSKRAPMLGGVLLVFMCVRPPSPGQPCVRSRPHAICVASGRLAHDAPLPHLATPERAPGGEAPPLTDAEPDSGLESLQVARQVGLSRCQGELNGLSGRRAVRHSCASQHPFQAVSSGPQR